MSEGLANTVASVAGVATVLVPYVLYLRWKHRRIRRQWEEARRG